MESLETRRLLSAAAWSAQDTFIGLDQAAANYPNITGKGETVVLIDRGVDYNASDLGGGVGPGYKIVYEYDYQDSTPDVFPYDGDAHGTGSASELAADPHVVNGQLYQGVAPGVNLVALKVNDTADAINAFNWIIANQKQYNIVAVNYVNPTGQVDTNQLVSQLQTVRNDGIFVAGAIGNYGPSTGYSFVDHLIYAVGSEDVNGNISSFSPRGSAIDMVAPGENVDITWYANGQTMDLTSSGTSWAGPQIVGAAALIKQVDPNFTPDQILSIMQDSAHWVYDATSNMSYPSLNVNAAIALAYQRAGSSVTATPTPSPTPTPVTSVPAAPAVESPFLGTPFTTGQTIPAADYDKGGEGVAYHDTTPGNDGGDDYRTDNGVDTAWTSADGGTEFVGWTKTGEWINYTVDVTTAGSYTLSFRAASDGSGGAIHFNVDGKSVTPSVTIPDTGGWSNYTTLNTASVYLSAGEHTVTLAIDSVGGSGYAGNIDSFRFDAGSVDSGSGGSGSSSTSSGSGSSVSTTPSVSTAASLSVDSTTTSTLTLAWDREDFDGMKVILDRKTIGTDHWKKMTVLQSGKLKTAAVSAGTYTDHGLSMGTSYQYRLQIVTSRGRVYDVDTSGTTLTRHLHHGVGHRAKAA